MITEAEYRLDPCGTLSIPLWKWNRMTIPENMRILHEKDYGVCPGWQEKRYFRLYHDLRNIQDVFVSELEIRTVQEQDFEAVLEIIRESYPGIQVDREWLSKLTLTPAYAPELWLIGYVNGSSAGCLIADYDPQVREGILEWVQVLPGFRRRGVGKALVCEALRRMQGNFATVSGAVESETSPEALYRSCGFAGNDVWYILRKT